MRPDPASTHSVLVVADRPDMGTFLTEAFRAEGHVAGWVWSLAEVEIAMRLTPYDVVLVDAELPTDGVEVVPAVRSAAPDAFVLLVTSGESDRDLVAGLDAGADDYVIWPVNLTILLARVRAHLRRTSADLKLDGAVIAIDDLTVDASSRRCHVRSREVMLRAKEFDLLWLLVRHSGSVVTRLELMSQVWDENWSGSTKTLDVTMAGLRRHLREVALAEGATLPPITTMRGHGYRLDARPAEVEAG